MSDCPDPRLHLPQHSFDGKCRYCREETDMCNIMKVAFVMPTVQTRTDKVHDTLMQLPSWWHWTVWMAYAMGAFDEYPHSLNWN